jgi:hypothetical protein
MFAFEPNYPVAAIPYSIFCWPRVYCMHTQYPAPLYIYGAPHASH